MADYRDVGTLPKIVIRQRVGRGLLVDLARERNVSVRDIVGSYRAQRFVDLRVEFMRRAKSAGIGSIIISRIIGRSRDTVLYHLSPRMQARKRAQRKRWAMKRVKLLPPQEVLREWFEYDGLNELFRWRKSPTTRPLAGRIAGTVRKSGGRFITVPGFGQFSAVRLAAIYVNGPAPAGFGVGDWRPDVEVRLG